MAPPIPQIEGVEHRFATVDGLRLHYAEAGGGEPLLLVHGWPQHWWMWRHHIVALAEAGNRVICPDLRGHGWSDKPRGNYRKDQLMRDLLGLLDELGIERIRWVGHDWGAWTGMLAALNHPERIERFVSMSIPHPWLRRRFDPRTLWRVWYQLVLAAPGLGKLAIGRLGMPEWMLQGGRGHGRFSAGEIAVYADVLHEPETVEASMQMYRQFLMRELPQFMGGDFRDLRLIVPTLWIVGGKDFVANVADDGYVDFTDDMTLERVEEAGHFLPEDFPELVLERLLAFL